MYIGLQCSCVFCVRLYTNTLCSIGLDLCLNMTRFVIEGTPVDSDRRRRAYFRAPQGQPADKSHHTGWKQRGLSHFAPTCWLTRLSLAFCWQDMNRNSVSPASRNKTRQWVSICSAYSTQTPSQLVLLSDTHTVHSRRPTYCDNRYLNARPLLAFAFRSPTKKKESYFGSV